MDEPWWRNQSAAFEAVVHAAEMQGYITLDKFAEIMPHADPDMIEDILAMLQMKGIEVVENEDSAES